jgi:GT2 family glycosyltransferase
VDVTVCIGTFGDDSWRKLALDRAAMSCERKVLHVHDENLMVARNRAAEKAQSEWLCFLDADDELAPGYFDAMEQGTADLRGPSVQYVVRGMTRPPKIWPPMDLTQGNYLVIGTLIRKEMFDEVGGFRDYPLYEDWDLWLRCHLAGASIELLPEAVYIAHARSDSRNRAPDRATRLHWHKQIAQDNGVA